MEALPGRDGKAGGELGFVADHKGLDEVGARTHVFEAEIAIVFGQDAFVQGRVLGLQQQHVGKGNRLGPLVPELTADGGVLPEGKKGEGQKEK